ncbi:MAG TPA: hypothetical protein PK796_04785 [Bacteroidales bacterium]|jgi:uncharacterized membrane protein|nr:hypothetical protein [Bacteroidales bacterium]
MKRLLQTLAWISAAAGIVLLILGIIAVFAGGILWNHMWSTYFYPASTFIVLGIFLLLAEMSCCCKKE